MKSNTMAGVKLLQCLCSFLWLACGTSYRVVCRVFSKPKTTVVGSTRKVMMSFLQYCGHIIRLPATEEQEERKAVGEGFARLGNHSAFQMALGTEYHLLLQQKKCFTLGFCKLSVTTSADLYCRCLLWLPWVST